MFTCLLASLAMGQNGTTGDVSSLAVSRNCIAFCGYDGQIQLRKKEGTASKSISVPGGARYVRWTSNGYRLVIAGPEQVSMVTQDGLSAGPILSLLPWKEISALDVAGNGASHVRIKRRHVSGLESGNRKAANRKGWKRHSKPCVLARS
jgi:hypothetical protein